MTPQQKRLLVNVLMALLGALGGIGLDNSAQQPVPCVDAKPAVLEFREDVEKGLVVPVSIRRSR